MRLDYPVMRLEIGLRVTEIPAAKCLGLAGLKKALQYWNAVKLFQRSHVRSVAQSLKTISVNSL